MEAEKEEREIEKKVQESLKAKDLRLESVKEDKLLMEQVVRELKFKRGIAGRQIARFLGINRNVVQRIKNI